jgi:CRISPR-associated protein Cas6
MRRNPERSARAADLRFELRGECLPIDHGQALAEAVCAQLPWLADERGAGIHAVRGAAMGGGLLGISRRARLVLRLPLTRLDDALALAGRSLQLGADTLQVGPGKPWPIASCDTVYARLVIVGPAEEQPFAQALGALLRACGGACEVVLGKPRSLATREGVRRGFSVLLHGMTPELSLSLQEGGLGELRLHGCGIVVPYKSIAAV